MLLSHKTTIGVGRDDSNIIGHMCYAAYKLWNVCNYERIHYKELGLDKYPDWYYQKKVHKEDLWYRNLPSQTAQEVCKMLDKAWKSFYALKRSGGIMNPNPPRFKHGNMAITYMQNAIVHETGSERVRLSLPKQLRGYMRSEYGISEEFLYLENKVFRNTDQIKQIRICPPEHGCCEVIVIYEIPDMERLPDNGRYLSIDLGLHNLFTCYDPGEGTAFIIGRKYLSLCRYYDKEISRVQSEWYRIQSQKGVRYLKISRHIRKLYRKKKHAVKDYLHKVTRYIVSYCIKRGICRVVIGDIRHIREKKNMGHMTNQKLHGLPYEKIYSMLEYKLSLEGIGLIRQDEAYTSQCSPHSDSITKICARKENRKTRGLYKDGKDIYNADAVGAYNILRKYFREEGMEKEMSVTGLSHPEIIKVAV